MHPLRSWLAVFASLTFVASTPADHFDDHDLAALKSAASGKAVASIRLIELAGAPKAIAGASASTLLVVQTSEGDWCKMLVRPGGVKLAGRQRSMLQIERLTTYSANPRRGIKADRRELYLFEGFALDLDLGQIVPPGMGEDLAFEREAGVAEAAKANDEKMMAADAPLGPPRGTIRFAKDVKAYLPAAALVAASAKPPTTVRTGAIGPADYVGKYRLDVDGKFTGVLELKRLDDKLVGSFRSEQTGNSYDATVELGRPGHRVAMKIAFPRTELELDGCLWTKDRRRIAGLAKMEDRTFGFLAERTD